MAVGFVSLQQAARAAFSTGPSATSGKGFAQALTEAVATTGTSAQPPKHAVLGVDVGNTAHGPHARHSRTAADGTTTADTLAGNLGETLQASLSGSSLRL